MRAWMIGISLGLVGILVFTLSRGPKSIEDGPYRGLFDKVTVMEVTIEFTDLPTSQRLVAARNKGGAYTVTCLMINKQAPASSRQASIEVGSNELKDFITAAQLETFKVRGKSSSSEPLVHNLRDLIHVSVKSEGRPKIEKIGHAEINFPCVKAVDQLFKRAFRWN